MFGSASPSLADIAAVTRNNGGNGDGNYGFGEGWWIIIILLAIFGGFGGYGYGGYGAGAGGGATPYATSAVTQADLQRGFDTQSILGSLRGIEQGLCSLGYDQLAQFNNISTQVMQAAFGIQNDVQASTVANMQNTWQLSSQISDCCCENRMATKDLQYAMAAESCKTNTNIHQTGDNIINSQNQGFQMLNNTINNRFTQLEMANDQRYIRELEMKLARCDSKSDLADMSTYLINTLRPTATPAYIVPDPYCGCGSRYSGSSCGSQRDRFCCDC